MPNTGSTAMSGAPTNPTPLLTPGAARSPGSIATSLTEGWRTEGSRTGDGALSSTS